jgi:hypothetical protein
MTWVTQQNDCAYVDTALAVKPLCDGKIRQKQMKSAESFITTVWSSLSHCQKARTVALIFPIILEK